MRSSVRVIVAIAVMALAHARVNAGQPVFKTATELVSLNVSVVGKNDQPVAGLEKDQFVVLEDGVQQEVKFFSAGEMALDVIILLDTSASMTGSMELVQAAATRFSHSLRPGDRRAVMGISNGLRILQPFTNDAAAVDAAIESTRP